MKEENILYFKSLGYIFSDYTEKIKSRESFEDFKYKIYYQKYNKCIFYFYLNKAVSGIAEYYKDRFNVCDTSDHFLILYRCKWSIFENICILQIIKVLQMFTINLVFKAHI